jgi:hypothetical protein
MAGTGPAPAGWRGRFASAQLRARLFLVSYAPLAIIFAWQCRTTESTAVWAASGVALLLLAITTTYGQLRKNAVLATVTDVRDRGGDVSGYLAGYLLPFIAGPPEGWSGIGAYATYFLVAGIVYVRSDLALINPTLYLIRWRVIEGQVSGRRLLILCRDVPSNGDSIRIVSFLDVAVRKDRP